MAAEEAKKFGWYDVRLIRASRHGLRRKIVVDGTSVAFDARAGSKTQQQALRMSAGEAEKLARSGDFKVKPRRNAPPDELAKPAAEQNDLERRFAAKKKRREALAAAAAEKKAAGEGNDDVGQGTDESATGAGGEVGSTLDHDQAEG